LTAQLLAPTMKNTLRRTRLSHNLYCCNAQVPKLLIAQVLACVATAAKPTLTSALTPFTQQPRQRSCQQAGDPTHH
jgi:hypothetical protein